PRPALWVYTLWASLGAGLLLKSLVGALFPIAGGIVYLLITRQLLSARIWQRLRPVSGIFLMLVIAVPWHLIAAVRNPPFWEFTMRSAPGDYHGFLWFYFINEQLLRFLNMRYPRDYNTVPRVYFWLFHLLWLFPWSVYFPAVLKESFRPADRAGRTRLLALCWSGFILIFFTFSTTQEYYSMPCYPALALLLGAALAVDGPRIKYGSRVLVVIAMLGAAATLGLAAIVWHYPAPGDISQALESRPGTYTLALDHMKDLTIPSFAYLRLPLVIAGLAFLTGAVGLFRARPLQAALSAAVMMTLFFHAARLALVVFDPYLSSRPLANALLRAPEGDLIVDHHYYTYSSVFFYTDRSALLLNGRVNNLVYGSYAPDAPDVFIDDARFRHLWLSGRREYIVAAESRVPQLRELVGDLNVITVATSGGKVLLTNKMIPTVY
ncbi:MAG TPA: glycosyltransferase family 39 protein, partial [Bryobacteraceae bacterium]|nr:glycosyltransferase family 39 protein [Bryobacteraceae bacterium]